MKASLLAATALSALCALAATPALAQYKIVRPDGTVTFSDRMPDANQGRVSNVVKRGGDLPTAELPYELRQVVQKFPVTIYTAKDCDPCKQGRDLLMQRGVPFTEHTAITAEDRGLWQKVTGVSEAPVLLIGKQRLGSFNGSVWNETLDAAGYPATSKLPSTYRQPEAIPLATRQAPRPTTRPVVEADTGTDGTPSGAGGIRF